MTGRIGGQDDVLHIHDEKPPGQDIFQDRENFPRNGKGKFDGWHRILRGYLERQHACSDCLDVFEKCWEDYVRCEKS